VTRWKLLVLVEVAALGIAMVMPVTPSKTGSRWIPAELVFADPSYGQEVLVYFVLANIVFGVFAAALVTMVRLEEGRGNR
jgi:hypothetical protein